MRTHAYEPLNWIPEFFYKNIKCCSYWQFSMDFYFFFSYYFICSSYSKWFFALFSFFPFFLFIQCTEVIITRWCCKIVAIYFPRFISTHQFNRWLWELWWKFPVRVYIFSLLLFAILCRFSHCYCYCFALRFFFALCSSIFFVFRQPTFLFIFLFSYRAQAHINNENQFG